jgi:pyruvate ferredoxin oxidoreductase delta subunit
MKITPGAVVAGGSSVTYLTGYWRDQRPVIQFESCKVCGICREVCPDSAVYESQGQYFIDYDYCKGCGLCAYECPANCIEMSPEEK